MGVNLEVRKLHDEIVHVLNASPIPVEVKRMVLDDIRNETKELSELLIQKELLEEQKALIEEQKKQEATNEEKEETE